MKRTIILLMMTLLGIHVSFAYDFEVDGVYYNVIKGSTNQVKVARSPNYNYKGNVTIPKTINANGNTYNVSEISVNAFRDCKELKSVSIANGVAYIGTWAFENCI